MLNYLFAFSGVTAWTISAGLCFGQTGIIRGRVTDDGKTPPNDGIPTVTVTVKTETETLSAASAADGTFEVTEVPPGAATVSLVKDGYAKKPTEKSLNVIAGKNPSLDIYMWQPGATGREYFSVVAKNVMGRVEKDRVKRHGLAVEWVHITSSGLPLSFKGQLVAELYQLDDGLGQELPIIGEYKSAGIDKVVRLQNVFLEAAQGDAGFPGMVREVIAKERISKGLCADALVSTMYSVELSTERQRVFAEKLQQGGFDSEISAALQPWTQLPKIEWGIHNPEKANVYKVLLQSYMPN